MSRKSKYSTDEVLAILREVAAGTTVREVCKRHGFTEKTFYRWRARFGHGPVAVTAPPSESAVTSVRDAELRYLREENRRLKELVADLTLEVRTLLRNPAPVRLLPASRDRR